MNHHSALHEAAPLGERGRRFPVHEETLKTEKIQVERKTFIIVLKENPRGRFLRITEDVGGRRDSIIVPSTGLDDFRRAIDDMVKADKELPVGATPTPAATPA